MHCSWASHHHHFEWTLEQMNTGESRSVCFIWEDVQKEQWMVNDRVVWIWGSTITGIINKRVKVTD